MDWDRYLRLMVSRLFQVLFLILPLVWTGRTSELFELPKMFMVYIFTILILAVWLMRMVGQRKILWQKTPFTIPLIIFFISQLVATIVSIDRHTSLFGYYSRFHGGLISTVSYLILFFALVSNVPQKAIKSLIVALVCGGVVVSLYALPEHFKISPSCLILRGQASTDCWSEATNPKYRIFGTFGQPNWLAAYLTMILILPLSWGLADFKKQKLMWGLFGVFLLTLIFTKSRSGLAATGVGLTGYWSMVFWFRGRLIKLKRVGLNFTVVAAMVAVLLLSFGEGVLPSSMKREASQTKEVTPTPLAAGTQLETGGTESGDIRRIVWKGAIDIWRHYPWFGSGVETFAYSYYFFRPSEHNLVSEWDYLYNKAHNEFLNLAATSGTFGLASYLVIMIGYGWWTVKQIKSEKLKMKNAADKKQSQLVLMALLAGFMAVATSNFFGFSTVVVGLLFFMFPALAWRMATPDANEKVEQTKIKFELLVGWQLILIVSLYMVWRTANWLRADMAYATGKQAESTDYLTALTNLQEAVRLLPREPVYKDELGQAAGAAALSLLTVNESSAAAQMAEAALELSDEVIWLSPVNINFYKSRARLLVDLLAFDPSLLDQAHETLSKALTLAPTDAKLWFNLALVEIQQNKLEQAQATLLKTIELKRDYEQAVYTLGLVYEDLEEFDKAANQYGYFLEKLNPDNETIQAALARVATKAATKLE